mgnify:FL=1
MRGRGKARCLVHAGKPSFGGPLPATDTVRGKGGRGYGEVAFSFALQVHLEVACVSISSARFNKYRAAQDKPKCSSGCCQHTAASDIPTQQCRTAQNFTAARRQHRIDQQFPQQLRATPLAQVLGRLRWAVQVRTGCHTSKPGQKMTTAERATPVGEWTGRERLMSGSRLHVNAGTGRCKLQTLCGTRGLVSRERWTCLLRCRNTLRFQARRVQVQQGQSSTAHPKSTAQGTCSISCPPRQVKLKHSAAQAITNAQQQMTSQPSNAGQHSTSQQYRLKQQHPSPAQSPLYLLMS